MYFAYQCLIGLSSKPIPVAINNSLVYFLHTFMYSPGSTLFLCRGMERQRQPCINTEVHIGIKADLIVETLTAQMRFSLRVLRAPKDCYRQGLVQHPCPAVWMPAGYMHPTSQCSVALSIHLQQTLRCSTVRKPSCTHNTGCRAGSAAPGAQALGFLHPQGSERHSQAGTAPQGAVCVCLFVIL